MPSVEAPAKPTTDYLFDFVYIDRPRLASYLAQMVDDGVLLSTTKTDQTTDGITSLQKSGLPPIYSVNNTDTATVANTLERQFDASWSAFIDTLHLLDEKGFVTKDVQRATIGCVVHVVGQLEVLDLRILREMWPIVGKAVGQQEFNGTHKQKQAAKQEAEFIATMVSKLPHTLQMTLLAEDFGEAWSTLDPAHMTISTEDLAFKHGGTIAGEWHVLGILDAVPDEATAAAPITGNQVRAGMLQVLSSMRTILGRPSGAYGITPIAVFRPIRLTVATETT